MKVMKYFRVASLGVLGLSIVIAADIPSVTVEEIIAKVNGDIVTRGDIIQERKAMESDMRQQGPKEGFTGARLEQAIADRQKDVLRDKIDQLLLIQKGKELNLNIDGQLTKQLADIQKQSGIADPDKFQQYVREQTGVPFEEYKARLRDTMLTQKVVREEIGRTVTIKPEEEKKYYDEHKGEFVREEKVYLREIFISTEGKDAAGIAAAQKKANDVANRAAAGEKFADLARDNSDDAMTAKDGGSIGGFKKGQLREDVEKAVWDKERGSVTKPLKVDNGFLIYRVEEHTKAGQETFEEAQGEIYEKLFMPRMEPAIRIYLTKLRQEAFLEIKPGYVDSGAAPGKDTTWIDPAQLKPETITKSEVAKQSHRKKLLWVVPVPGTKTSGKDSSSSSR